MYSVLLALSVIYDVDVRDSHIVSRVTPVREIWLLTICVCVSLMGLLYVSGWQRVREEEAIPWSGSDRYPLRLLINRDFAEKHINRRRDSVRQKVIKSNALGSLLNTGRKAF